MENNAPARRRRSLAGSAAALPDPAAVLPRKPPPPGRQTPMAPAAPAAKDMRPARVKKTGTPAAQADGASGPAPASSAPDGSRPEKAKPGKAQDLQIGARVRHARMLSGIRMRELAQRVGCTESMISKIENGHVVPSLPMLNRLVEAMGRDLGSFFGADPNSPGIIQRAGERPVTATDPIRHGTGIHYERLVPFGAGNLLEANIHVIEAGGSKEDQITHQGETLGYVVEGQLELTIEDTTYLLGVGDSFFFRNHFTNRYRNPGPGPARVVWVNTPQVH